MSSPFLKHIQGTDLIFVLGETEFFLAILEEKPLVLGHVLIVAKREVDDLFDLEDRELAEVMLFSKRLAAAIAAVVPCQKVGIAALGLVTRHAHLHLVPISSADDLNFTRSKLNPERDTLLRMSQLIKDQLK